MSSEGKIANKIITLEKKITGVKGEIITLGSSRGRAVAARDVSSQELRRAE